MKDNTPNRVQKIENLLKSLDLKQSELATKLNISRQRMNNIAAGRQFFSEEQQIVLCKEYNVNLNWLLADVGSMFIDEKKDYSGIEFNIDEAQQISQRLNDIELRLKNIENQKCN